MRGAQSKMLAADRLMLQSSIKERSVVLKSKELDLYTKQLGELGMQAAVLASCAVVAIVELEVPEITPRAIQMVFNIAATVTLAANLSVISSTLTISVLGGSLALRGPDGSMFRSVDAVHQERRRTFAMFGAGVVAIHVMGVAAAFVKMRPETAIIAGLVLVSNLWHTIQMTRNRFKTFHFNDSETVNFDDIFAVGPDANVEALSQLRMKRASSAEDVGNGRAPGTAV